MENDFVSDVRMWEDCLSEDGCGLPEDAGLRGGRATGGGCFALRPLSLWLQATLSWTAANTLAFLLHCHTHQTLMDKHLGAKTLWQEEKVLLRFGAPVTEMKWKLWPAAIVGFPLPLWWETALILDPAAALWRSNIWREDGGGLSTSWDTQRDRDQEKTI